MSRSERIIAELRQKAEAHARLTAVLLERLGGEVTVTEEEIANANGTIKAYFSKEKLHSIFRLEKEGMNNAS